MPFFSGFAEGASNALTTMRQEQQRINEANANREQQALLHLTTSPNSDIAASAAAALMHPKPPAGGFLKNLFGQVQDRPEYPTLRGLLEATRGGQGTAGGGGAAPDSTGGTPPTAPPAEGAAALPAGSPVEPSQQPVSAKVAGQTMGSPTPAPPSGITAPTLATGAAAVPPPSTGAGAPTAPAPRAAQGPPTATAAPSPSNPLFFTAPQQAGLASQAEMEGKLAALGFTKHPQTGEMLDPQGKPLDPVLVGHLMGLQPHYVIDPTTGNVTTMVGTGIAGMTPGIGGLRGPAEQIEVQAQNLIKQNPNLTLAEARQQAGAAAAGATQATQAAAGSRATTAAVTAEYAAPRAAAGLAQTEQATATGRAREQSLIASTVATWQRVNGSTPPSPAQRVNMAREILGSGPDILAGDVSRVADAIGASFQGGGGRSSAPPPPGVPPTTPPPPAGRGRRPAAGAPPATGPLQGATDATGLGDTVRTPKYYSAAGRQTVTAIGAVERLLPKIEATIRQSGLAESNNPIPEKVASLLYGLGISPGEDMEALLQNAGMSKAYGLRGLLGGRSNTQLQGIYGQHLIDQGDSPKLILQKIHTLQANIPDIRAAVDEGESAQIGGKGKGAKSATTPPPPVGHPEGQRGTLNGQPVVWETRGGKAGWWPASTANGAAATPVH